MRMPFPARIGARSPVTTWVHPTPGVAGAGAIMEAALRKNAGGSCVWRMERQPVPFAHSARQQQQRAEESEASGGAVRCTTGRDYSDRRKSFLFTSVCHTCQ